MKTAVVTGAFGFAGANLVECLLKNGYKAYCVGRKKPTLTHNDRFEEGVCLKKIYLEMEEFYRIPEFVPEKPDFFFHLAWGGKRDDFDAQRKNVDGALKAMDAAAVLSCKRFVGIGSQAEYGIKSEEELITEDLRLEPFTAYGACKAAAFYMLKEKAALMGIEFVWGRIFSLIGKYEPEGRMLPDLVKKLQRKENVQLSSCLQYWDYLDATDAAAAILGLAEKGRNGEDYNIANGEFRELKEYVLEAAQILRADPKLINFGNRAEPFVSLRPSVEKLCRDTGWKPEKTFEYSVRSYNK
jgi:nucleoside-diphosphate-sugar epimerase